MSNFSSFEKFEEGESGQCSRRALLQRAGWILAASAFMPRGLMAADSVSPVTLQLSTYMAEAGGKAIPENVLELLKQHILDTFAAMISGSQLPPGVAAIKFAQNYGGEKISTVAGSNLVCGPIEAALTNGMLAHSDETDDSHAPSETHPGCSVVPATLAVGEKFGIDGTRFLRAVALGYDVCTRMMMAIGTKDFLIGGIDNTHAVGGMFGSSAAAASAANLNAQQMRWVLDYAVQQASGNTLWQRDIDHIEKGFVFAGMPARSGVTAALVVQSGWTGVNDVLSGPYNFFIPFGPKVDPSKLVDKLGERYEVTRTNIKKWTVGSPIQAPLDALQNILNQHHFEPDQVKQVNVRVATEEAALVNNREMPDICLQHMIAVMLIDKTASFHSAHDKPRMQDAAVLKQRAKVQLIPDDQLEHDLPKREAIVEVTLNDGTKYTEKVTAVRGTEENPMTHDEVVAKARDLIAPVVGDGQCNKLIETVFTLEKVQNVRDLRPLLQKA